MRFVKMALLVIAFWCITGGPLDKALGAEMQDGYHVIHDLGAHRVAASREEAMRYLDVIDQLGYTPAAAAYFRATVPLGEVPTVDITNQKYAAMAFSRGGMCRVEANVWLQSLAPQLAERWVYAPTGEALDLPLKCRNFARPVIEHHCFEFKLGFDGRPLTSSLWFDELEEKSPEEIAAFKSKLFASECFKVTFADGSSVKPGDVCPKCRGAFTAWPPTLGEHRKIDRIVITVPAGESRVISFPDFAAVHHGTYCPQVRGVWQGYVDPAVTRMQIAAKKWEYPDTIEPDPQHRR